MKLNHMHKKGPVKKLNNIFDKIFESGPSIYKFLDDKGVEGEICESAQEWLDGELMKHWGPEFEKSKDAIEKELDKVRSKLEMFSDRLEKRLEEFELD